MQIDSNLSSGVIPSRPQVIEDVKRIVAEHMGIPADTIGEKCKPVGPAPVIDAIKLRLA